MPEWMAGRECMAAHTSLRQRWWMAMREWVVTLACRERPTFMITSRYEEKHAWQERLHFMIAYVLAVRRAYPGRLTYVGVLLLRAMPLLLRMHISKYLRHLMKIVSSLSARLFPMVSMVRRCELERG